MFQDKHHASEDLSCFWSPTISSWSESCPACIQLNMFLPMKKRPKIAKVDTMETECQVWSEFSCPGLQLQGVPAPTRSNQNSQCNFPLTESLDSALSQYQQITKAIIEANPPWRSQFRQGAGCRYWQHGSRHQRWTFTKNPVQTG